MARERFLKCCAAALASMSVVLAGCALRPVLGPQHGVLEGARVDVAKGDRLRVLTRDGRRRMVTVVDANETALVTSRETIPIADLVFVEKEELSGAKTAAGVGAASLIVLVAAAATGGYAAILATAPIVP